MTLSGGRLARVGKRLALCLIPLVVLAAGAAVAEVYARHRGLLLDPAALEPSPLGGTSRGPQSDARCYRPSPTVGYEAVPNRCRRNELGMITDSALEKPPGAFRVLVLGDSIANQHRWVQAMADELAQGLPGRKVQYFNAGVPGYDTCHELRTLEERGLKTDPDLVLVQFCPNDFMVASNVLPVGHDRVQLLVGTRAWEYPAWVLHSHLLTFVLTRVVEADVQRVMRMDQAVVIRACFERIQSITRQRGIPVMVAAFPALVSVHSKRSGTRLGSHVQLEHKIKKLLAGLGIRYLDLRQSLAGGPPLSSYRNMVRDVWHPNDEGQRIIGKALARDILRAGFAGQGR